MKNVIGTPARGDSFFRRDREIKKILDRLNDGNNLQIAAPRRIGKTSILFYLMDNMVGNYVYVYLDSEAINNEQDFYQKLLKELMKVDEIKNSKKLKKLFEDGGKFLKKIKSIKIMGNGLDFAEEEADANYLSDVENLLSDLILDENKQLVILMDEFPQTIQNIVEINEGGTIEARQFLKSNRELRLNHHINQKVRFIITGSIGLNHTVSAIDSSAFVNDLNSLEVEPLSKEEAKEFVDELLATKGLRIDKEANNYLLQKIEWLIPFHIQLSVLEIIGLTERGQQINKTIIDASFDKIIEDRNHNHFEHYFSRLKQHFKGAEFEFSRKLLCAIANDGTIDTSVIFNLSVEFHLQESYKNIINILVYDGYINNVGDKNNYRFNSPIVKMWWQKFIC
ncbi:MAG TPA: ATP-binding protein [Puia sp.]|nr:ATP-binding protein [Puia sp.]